MYSTCLFCNSSLGSNDRIEHFAVGRRLAYDGAKGRLWVVCPSCARWNLTPLEERWEAIEECERLFRGTYVRVSTGNVALARFDDRFELVRIGKPLRPEFAAWRYSPHFSARRRESQYIIGAGVAAAALAAVTIGPAIAPALTMGAISIVAVPGLTSAMGVFPVVGVLAARDYIQHDRVVGKFVQGKRVVVVRSKHLQDIELDVGADGSTCIAIPHDNGWTTMEGAAAMHATGVLLAGANRYGAPAARVRDAVGQIERVGDAAGFLAEASARNGWRRGKLMSMLNTYRGLGALQLSPTERLALEMSVHEETERRAMQGELSALKAAWEDAEIIAKICDEDLTASG